MCVYCMMDDWQFRHDPPWHIPDTAPYKPLIPAPAIPPTEIKPWDLTKLREYRDLLKEVKELEDKLGCPCVPNKADYLKILQDRIAALEAKT